MGSGSGPLHIANDGVKNTLHIVDKVLMSDDSKELYRTAQENQQVFEANDCHLVQKAMQAPPRTAPLQAFRHVSDARWPASPVPRTTRRRLRS